MSHSHGLMLGRKIIPPPVTHRRRPWFRSDSVGGETAPEWHADCTCGTWSATFPTRAEAERGFDGHVIEAQKGH